MILFNSRHISFLFVIVICVLMPCLCRRLRYKRGDDCHEDIISMYEVSFFGDWSRKAFSKMYPRYRPHAQWSKLVGRTHDSTYKLWREGELASPTLQKFVEEGSSRLMEQDAQGFNGTLDMFSAAPIRNGVGRSTVRIIANGKNSKLSFVVKLIPSPDWFVGIDSVDLCRAGRWRRRIHMTMRPMDGGTDKGLTYTSPNWPTLPQEPVYQILPTKPRHPASPFYDPDVDKLPRIAHVLIERIGEFTRRGKRKPSKFQNATNIFLPNETLNTKATTTTTTTVATKTSIRIERGEYSNEHETNGYSEVLPPDFDEIDESTSRLQPTFDDEDNSELVEPDTQTPPLLTQNDDSSAVHDHYMEGPKTPPTKKIYSDHERLTTNPLTRETSSLKEFMETPSKPTMPHRTTDPSESEEIEGGEGGYVTPHRSATAISKPLDSAPPAPPFKTFIEPTEPTRPDYKARSLFRDEYGQQHGLLYEEERKREKTDDILHKNGGVLDCLVTDWGAWGQCSKTCGFGVRMRKRQILQQPENGGSACPRVALDALCGSMRTCGWKHFSIFAQRSRRRRHHRVNLRKQ